MHTDVFQGQTDMGPFYFPNNSAETWLSKQEEKEEDEVWITDKFLFILASLGTSSGVLNKDPTIWLDGARSPTKYVCKYIKY